MSNNEFKRKLDWQPLTSNVSQVRFLYLIIYLICNLQKCVWRCLCRVYHLHSHSLTIFFFKLLIWSYREFGYFWTNSRLPYNNFMMIFFSTPLFYNFFFQICIFFFSNPTFFPSISFVFNEKYFWICKKSGYFFVYTFNLGYISSTNSRTDYQERNN